MNTIDSFIKTTMGTYINIEWKWVAQSPDFGMAYLRHMTGDTSLLIRGNAIDWADPEHPDLAQIGTWHPVESGNPLRGDLCVFSNHMGYGTVGVHRGEVGHDNLVPVWSQNPGPVREMDLGGKRGRDRLVGWWHLHNAG